MKMQRWRLATGRKWARTNLRGTSPWATARVGVRATDTVTIRVAIRVHMDRPRRCLSAFSLPQLRARDRNRVRVRVRVSFRFGVLSLA